jgi:TPR repeat protein
VFNDIVLSWSALYRPSFFYKAFLLLVIYLLGSAAALSDDWDAIQKEAIKLIDSNRDDEAIKLVQSLADDGDPRAQVQMAHILCNYMRPKQKRRCADAATWYEKAATSGNAEAMCNLGIMLIKEGEEIPPDVERGISLMRSATEQWKCLVALGIQYQNGKVVPQDFTLAHMYFNLASDEHFREKVADKMSRDQIAEAQRMARDWVKEHPKP